jgi:V/A-type H+-transporting ATPase subunit K
MCSFMGEESVMDLRQVKKDYISKVLMLTLVLAAFCVATGVGTATAFAANGDEGSAPTEAVERDADSGLRWDISIAIAVAIAIPCLAAGYAVGKVGAAALGAASEKPELLTRSLLFVALAEGIAIYGLLVAVLLYLKLE